MNRGGRYSDNQRQSYGNQGGYRSQGNQGYPNNRRQGGGIQAKMRDTRNQIRNNQVVGGRGSRGMGQRRPLRQNPENQYQDNRNQGSYQQPQRNRQNNNNLREDLSNNNRRGGQGLRRIPQRVNAYRTGGAQAYGRRQLQREDDHDQRRIGINQRSKRINKVRPVGRVQNQRQAPPQQQRQQQQQSRRNQQQLGDRRPPMRTLGQRRPRQQQQPRNQNPNQRQNQQPRPPRVSGTGAKALVKLPDEAQLKTLQVKAELNKLGEAPRAYLDKLEFDSMQVDNHPGRLTLDSRFNKIQGARPNLGKGSQGNGKTLRLVNRPKQAGSRRY
eukprot:403331919